MLHVEQNLCLPIGTGKVENVRMYCNGETFNLLCKYNISLIVTVTSNSRLVHFLLCHLIVSIMKSLLIYC